MSGPSALDQAECRGIRKPLGAWAVEVSDETGESYAKCINRIMSRVTAGWDYERAIFCPARERRDTSYPWQECSIRIKQLLGSTAKASRTFGISESAYRNIVYGRTAPCARVGRTMRLFLELLESLERSGSAEDIRPDLLRRDAGDMTKGVNPCGRDAVFFPVVNHEA